MSSNLELINQIFQVCIVPLLAVLTTYLVKYIDAKKDELIVKKEKANANKENMLADKYIKMLADTIKACVIATNQTYVDSLKDKNAFDGEAQKEAFKKTSDAVMLILSQEAKDYLSTIYGDLNQYIITQIEASVNANKKKPVENNEKGSNL